MRNFICAYFNLGGHEVMEKILFWFFLILTFGMILFSQIKIYDDEETFKELVLNHILEHDELTENK